MDLTFSSLNAYTSMVRPCQNLFVLDVRKVSLTSSTTVMDLTSDAVVDIPRHRLSCRSRLAMHIFQMVSRWFEV